MKINPETKEVTYTWEESLALFDAINCAIQFGLEPAEESYLNMFGRFADSLAGFAVTNSIPPGTYNPEELFK